MERHIIAARRAAKHATQAAAAAQAEAETGALNVTKEQVALAAAHEATTSCKREREKAEEQAASAEKRVHRMVAEAHRLRTVLLEKKHQQFLARQRKRGKDATSSAASKEAKVLVEAALGAGEPAAQPFDNCLVSATAVTEGHNETDENSMARLLQSTQQSSCGRVGSICDHKLRSESSCCGTSGDCDCGCTTESLGDATSASTAAGCMTACGSDRVNAALEEATVARLQRGLRLAVAKDKAQAENQAQSEAQVKDCNHRESPTSPSCRRAHHSTCGHRMPRRQWMPHRGRLPAHARPSGRMPTRRHAKSLYCRTSDDVQRPTRPSYHEARADWVGVHNDELAHACDGKSSCSASALAAENLSAWIQVTKLRSGSF